MIYAHPVQLLHWTMAADFAFMWLCGFAMTTLAALWQLRIGVRLTNKPLPPPLFSRLERWAAQVVHLALHALPLAVTGPAGLAPVSSSGSASRCQPRAWGADSGMAGEQC